MDSSAPALPSPRATGPRKEISFVAPLQDGLGLLDDRIALLRLERLKAPRPGLAVLVIGQPRRLAPAPGRMLRRGTPAEDMHVHAPVIRRALLLPFRRRGVVQRPVA